jgi:hypothetical protein
MEREKSSSKSQIQDLGFATIKGKQLATSGSAPGKVCGYIQDSEYDVLMFTTGFSKNAKESTNVLFSPN